MSDTPRTDALLDGFVNDGRTDFACYDALIDFARQLERELRASGIDKLTLIGELAETRISRDQWKQVAEKLVAACKTSLDILAPGEGWEGRIYDEEPYGYLKKAIVEFNQLKESEKE